MALAFDNCTNGGSVTASSLTYAHTVTGSTPFLTVGIVGRVGATSLVTGVTYNGVAMTFRDGQQLSPGDRFVEAWVLAGASTGTNNVVISASASDFLESSAHSLSGGSTGSIDAFNTNFLASGTPNTNTLITVANNCWHVVVGACASGTPTAGTNSTLRGTVNGVLIMMDNNGVITPAGSHSMGMSGFNSSFGSGTIGISVAPFGAVASTSYNLSLLRAG